jgi:aspartate/glutamate racemase
MSFFISYEIREKSSVPANHILQRQAGSAKYENKKAVLTGTAFFMAKVIYRCYLILRPPDKAAIRTCVVMYLPLMIEKF